MIFLGLLENRCEYGLKECVVATTFTPVSCSISRSYSFSYEFYHSVKYLAMCDIRGEITVSRIMREGPDMARVGATVGSASLGVGE